MVYRTRAKVAHVVCWIAVQDDQISLYPGSMRPRFRCSPRRAAGAIVSAVRICIGVIGRHEAAIDPRFPKYPRLPVVACSGFVQKDDRFAGAGIETPDPG